jgi:hypothetical protein
MLSTCSNQGKLSNVATKNPKKPGRYYDRTAKYDTYKVSLTKIKNSGIYESIESHILHN